MWTRFFDMHSGGGSKEGFNFIYIEAPYDLAKLIFYNRFGHNPDRVSCTCCGSDYSIDDAESLEQATGYERGCFFDEDFDKYVECENDCYDYTPLDKYLEENKDILVIYDKDIKPEEKEGTIPLQGYVWHD